MAALASPRFSPARLVLAFVAACVTALALFVLMLALVTPPRSKLAQEPIAVASFVPMDGRDQNAATRTRQQAPQPPQPQTPQRPTPPTPAPTPAQANLPKLDLPMPTLSAGVAVSAAPTPSLSGLTAEAPSAPPAAPISSLAEAGPVGGAAGGPEQEVMPLNDIRPEYPLRARQRGIEGHIKLAFTITEQGRVENIRVLEASPPNVFDREARRAASRWRFAPRTEDGRAVAREAVKTLQFRLQ